MGRGLIQQHIVGMETVCVPEGVTEAYNQKGKHCPSGLHESGPHGLVDLNAWSLESGTVWKDQDLLG